MSYHQSVLLKEILQYLDPRPGQIFVDGTLGGGGHAEKLLERLAPEGLLIGMDRDPEALEAARQKLRSFGDKAMILHQNFGNIAQALDAARVRQVDGMLLDLGVSSRQLDAPQRGFSFQKEGPLDMRMNPGQSLTAAEIVNRYPRRELERILKDFGEERFARRISDRILRAREKQPIRTTTELSQIIFSAVPASYRYGRIHPATRSFQSLRLAVNKETEALQAFLEKAPGLLKPGGRLAVISFHSLEDRLVKRAFQACAKEGLGTIVTKKPLTAGEAEVRENPRSRSAKLRVFERGRRDGS